MWWPSYIYGTETCKREGRGGMHPLQFGLEVRHHYYYHPRCRCHRWVVIFVKVVVNVILWFMKILLLLLLLIVFRRSSRSFWIGLNDLGLESSFKWSDGSPVQYTKYAFRQPDDYFKQEDCVEMLKDLAAWNDNHCNRQNPYICKISGMFQIFHS